MGATPQCCFQEALSSANYHPYTVIESVTVDDLRPHIATFNLNMEQNEAYGSIFKTFRLTSEDSSFVLAEDIGMPLIRQIPRSIMSIVISESDSDRLVDIKNWFLSYDVDIPVFTHKEDLAKQLSSLAYRIQRSSRVAADASLRIAELRRLHEDLQNSYAGLRDYLHEGGYLVPRLNLLNIPDLDGAAIDSTVSVVEQRLPVEYQSLCGISLHVKTEAPLPAEGILWVEIYSPDQKNSGHLWKVPYARIGAGWITFAFEQDGGFIKSSAAIKIQYDAKAGLGPTFSLGRPQLRPDRVAVVDGIQNLRSLALKAWTSIRGAKLSVIGQMWPVFLSESKKISRIDITIDDCLEVINVTKDFQKADFETVVRDLDKSRVLVHPLEASPTIAELRLVCPSGTRQVTADIITDHENAGFVEYGMAVLPDGYLLYTGDISKISAQIEWNLIPPLTRTNILIDLKDEISDTMSLYLFTRVVDNASSDYCWAHFKKIYLTGEFSCN
jgi:hypothetical protein